jgi:hypothetical protein
MLRRFYVHGFSANRGCSSGNGQTANNQRKSSLLLKNVLPALARPMRDPEQLQGEFSFHAGTPGTGYAEWVVARREAVDVVADKLQLPLGRQVEVWLRGGVRLRGKLRLVNEVLFVDEDRIRQLELVVDGVAFRYPEIESCVAQD